MKMIEKESLKSMEYMGDEYIKLLNGKRQQSIGTTIYNQRTKKDNKETLSKQEDSRLDVAIITAIDDEYSAVLNVFPGTTKPNYENGASCFRQHVIREDKKISVGLFQQDAMGMVYAAILASRIIYKYKPRFLAMCGVCAGVDKEKTNLGDVVAFTPVYDYSAGKFKNGVFLPAYKQREVDENTKKILDKMIHDDSLLENIRSSVTCNNKPQEVLNAYICYSASGAAVLADEDHVQHLLEHQRNLSAIDMEAYAIAEAACLAGDSRVPWLVVKGVQDYADSVKNDNYREYAACASAFFMRKFLEYYFDQ